MQECRLGPNLLCKGMSWVKLKVRNIRGLNRRFFLGGLNWSLDRRRTTVCLSQYEHVYSCPFGYANHVTFFVVEVNPSLTAGGYSLEFLVQMYANT